MNSVTLKNTDDAGLYKEVSQTTHENPGKIASSWKKPRRIPVWLIVLGSVVLVCSVVGLVLVLKPVAKILNENESCTNSTDKCAANLSCSTTLKTCQPTTALRNGITFMPIPAKLNDSSSFARDVIKKVNDRSTSTTNAGLGGLGESFVISQAWYFKEELEANSQKYHCALILFRGTGDYRTTVVWWDTQKKSFSEPYSYSCGGMNEVDCTANTIVNFRDLKPKTLVRFV
jgi:hypothetical protein